MSTIAYRYGLLSPLDWGDDVREHLWLQNKLWNRLVEITREERARYRAIIGADEDVAPIQARIDALKAKKEALLFERKRERAKARKRVATPELDAQIKDLAQGVRDASAEAKELRTAAKARMKPALDEMNQWRFQAVKDARNASGLWWGNYNAVCQSYDVARTKAMKENAELRFHRFDGTGRFTCQIQGGATPEAIFSGKCSLVNVKPVQPEAFAHPSRGARKRAQRTELALTIYTHDGGRRMLTFPMIYHRPLPANAVVKQVVVTARKIGTKLRWHVVFTCAMPDEAEATNGLGAACGINLGFIRVLGGMRVAMLSNGHGQRDDLVLPQGWMDGMDHVEAIQADRDLRLNAAHAVVREIVGALPSDPPAPEPDPEPAPTLVGRLRSIAMAPKIGSAKLAAAVLRWRDERSDMLPEALAKLEAWRKLDKRLLEEQANLRDRLQAARTEKYRLWARGVVERYGVVAVVSMRLKEMAQVKARENGTENDLVAPARAQRHRASLYSLQSELMRQCEKAGAQFVKVDDKVTPVCHSCGAETAIATDDIMQSCEHCHKVWDRDENAAINARTFATTGAVPTREVR